MIHYRNEQTFGRPTRRIYLVYYLVRYSYDWARFMRSPRPRAAPFHRLMPQAWTPVSRHWSIGIRLPVVILYEQLASSVTHLEI
jgi:hypothetical protein